MEKMLELVNAMNAVSEDISLREGDVLYREKDAEGKVVSRFVIKMRPVANSEGVEEYKFVARKQKD